MRYSEWKKQNKDVIGFIAKCEDSGDVEMAQTLKEQIFDSEE